MRNTFIEELVAQAETNERIALVVGDLGYSVVEPFAEKFPDRFINAGVAEQNMMGLSAGMASEGYQVFVYSIANFPTFRCAEQIRNDVAYHNLPVTVVAVGGGLAYGNLGYSHHAIQDYGLMRMFPNVLIASPGDPVEVRMCMRYLFENPQPSYLRLCKSGEKNLHDSESCLSPGTMVHVHGDSKADILILTTGASLAYAKNWIDPNNAEKYAIYSMPLWGMNHKKEQLMQMRKWSQIITLEDHLIDCGFGSWLRESVGDSPDIVARIKVNALNAEVCGLVGTQEALNMLGGICNPIKI
jgi:transketolase